jgi:outer membrane protein assembly factor BamB
LNSSKILNTKNKQNRKAGKTFRRKNMNQTPKLKKMLSTTVLILLLSFSAFMACLQPVNAADVQPRAFLAANPNPVGVNQVVDVTILMQPIPPKATDKFHEMTVTITKPDGTTETKGPFTSSPIGSQYFTYYPTMIGTYKLQFSYPGETFTVGTGTSTYKSAVSPITELVVQQTAISPYQEDPVPTDYWTRPINAQHRNWWSISGNWLMRAYNSAYSSFGEVLGYNPYSPATRSPHVMWTKELTLGGLIGGEYSSYSYYAGHSYEPKLAPPIIMNGRMYYKIYQSGFSGSTGSIGTGFVCVDLRTGQEIFKNTQGVVSHGQVFNFLSANQMGGIAYLWDIFPLVISGAVPTVVAGQYKVYDAFTGDLYMTFDKALGGEVIYGEDGTIFVYTLNSAQGWFSMWNSSKAFQANGFMQGQASGLIQYRPRSGTYNWSSGLQWNVTVPPRSITTPGYGLNFAAISRKMSDNVIIAFAGGVTEARLHVAYSLTTGQELWAIDRAGPYPQFFAMGEGIYAQFNPVDMTWIGYDIQTGQQLWVSDPMEYPWGQYVANSIGGVIANGIMYVGGMDGYLHAYDITNGKKLWKFSSGNAGLETPYGSWPMGSGPIVAGGVVYCGTGEHSPTNPLFRGAKLFALDAKTGQEIWRINGWFSIDAIADGYLVGYNLYDNRIYCFGKGPSETTVSAPQTSVPQGTNVVISGTVTDQSTGQPNTPAISDENMGAYMAHLKEQQTLDMAHVSGVPVSLTAHAPDGSSVNIGTVVSNSYGQFSTMWSPPGSGLYQIVADFKGTDSYGSSVGSTALGVVAASEAQSTSNTDMYIIVATVVLLIAIAIAAIFIRMKR